MRKEGQRAGSGVDVNGQGEGERGERKVDGVDGAVGVVGDGVGVGGAVRSAPGPDVKGNGGGVEASGGERNGERDGEGDEGLR